MITVNTHFQKLQGAYLFGEIAERVSRFRHNNPNRELIMMGIGDVRGPLPSACLTAFEKASQEMGSLEGFRGYGPERGYAFLRESILTHDFLSRGVSSLSADDIFISDGSKCDSGNFQELFSQEIRVGIPDPVYPPYVDTNVMAGRSGAFSDGRYADIVYLECHKKNLFVPLPPEKEDVDLIYLCSPNNPTGAVASREQLTQWVAYAHAKGALILFDAAYVAFLDDPALPHSIYEIEGAEEVAVEFRSFSKTAGFTGVRCGYAVVPKATRVFTDDGRPVPLRALWNRRQTTKFNGVSYPVQRAAEAVFSPEGQKETLAAIHYYKENAALIRRSMEMLGYSCTGGIHSPYVWVQWGDRSWEAFHDLLEKAGVVVTPGIGFGHCGEGYIRISAFNSRENTVKAMERIREERSR